VLNKYFSSVFTVENLNCNEDDFPVFQDIFKGDQNDVLHEVCITEDIALNGLKKLCINKAPGVDALVPKVLVEIANECSTE